MSLVAPVLALMLHYTGAKLESTLVLAMFATAVFALGTASVGADLASKNLVLELAPDKTRPVYIGVNDTRVALPTLLLAAGGALVDWFGFPPVFIAIAVCGTAAAALSLALPKPTATPRRYGRNCAREDC